MFSYSPLVMNRPSLMEFLFSERCRIHGRQGLSWWLFSGPYWKWIFFDSPNHR